MTVERLIELLEEEYPQAKVQIEVTDSGFLTAWNVLDGCAFLDPVRLRTRPRSKVVHILCDRGLR